MESQTKLSKKLWKPPSFEDFNVFLPTKKIKLDTEDSNKNSQEIPNEPDEPKAINELAIHPKKVGEIRNWITWSKNEKAPILLLTGPAGCGKTTTLKVSAKDEGILIKEWINPVDKTEYETEPVFQNDIYDKFNFSETKQIDKFNEFIFRSSRYKSLFDEEQNVLILVEDIPNIFLWRPKHFHDFLEKYKIHGKSAIVFILTDDRNLNLTNNLFPNHIKTLYSITNIKFNPVNHSSLIKNLKALSDIYCSEKVSSQFLEQIVKNSGGDLRTATNNLFLFLRTSGFNINQLQKRTKKSKKSDGLGTDSKPLSERDSSFDFYHVLGRILYPKLKSEKEKINSENPHKMFLHDVHQIAEGWTNSFLKILHENYLHTFTKLKDIVQGSECFSFCDILDCNKELEEYLSLIGVITLMLKNTKPKKTGFNPLKKSFQFELNNPDYDIKMGSELHSWRLRSRDYVLDVNPFLKSLKINDEPRANVLKLCFWESEDCSESNEDLIEIEEFDN